MLPKREDDVDYPRHRLERGICGLTDGPRGCPVKHLNERSDGARRFIHLARDDERVPNARHIHAPASVVAGRLEIENRRLFSPRTGRRRSLPCAVWCFHQPRRAARDD